jgi:hypothetical protein
MPIYPTAMCSLFLNDSIWNMVQGSALKIISILRWIVLKTRSGSGLVPSNPDWNLWLTAGQSLVSTWL